MRLWLQSLTGPSARASGPSISALASFFGPLVVVAATATQCVPIRWSVVRSTPSHGFATNATKAKALYPLNGYATPQLALDAIGTDSLACAQRHTNQLLSSQVPLYMYEFDDRTAPSYFPKMPGFQPLAYHTSDIQYVFPLWHGGNLGIQHELNNKQEDLSDKLVTAWTNFAWTGNPNGQGNSPWPLYKNKPNAPGILSESIPALSTFTDAHYNAAHKCDFWDSISTY